MMIRSAILHILPLLLIAGCVATSNKPTNNRVSRARSTRYIHFNGIQDDPAVIHELFSLIASDALKVGDADVLLELYKRNESVGESEHIYAEEAPAIVVVSSADERVILKMDTFLSPKKIVFKIPRITPPVLCIYNPNGGNCRNCARWYVISLAPESFLKNLGQVASIRDFDGDGTDDLIWYEDIWEGGLGWFCHAGAPGAIILYHIEHGRLLPDMPKNIRRWRVEIEEFDVRIEAMSKEIPEHTNDADVEILQPRDSPLLDLILLKFLRYRLLRESEKGWRELRADLRYRNDQYFFFNFFPPKEDMSVRIGRWPVEDIENVVRESLENALRNNSQSKLP